MEVNSHQLRISGKVEIPPQEGTPTLGEDLTITIEANCVKIEEHDNQDGTKDIIYVLKPIIVI